MEGPLTSRYQLAWKEMKYEQKQRESVKLILRSYRDSYISASICMYLKLGAIGFTILDAIVGVGRGDNG